MKAVQINVTCGAGSTGRICVGISRALSKQNIENLIYYASGESDYPLSRKYMTRSDTKLQALKSRVFGNYGFNSAKATKRLILMLEKEKPDVVILHNLHGHNCHLEMLFEYLKQQRIKTVWVFHDCWAFTGYCPHYDMIGCDRWTDGCHSCPLKNEFSWIFDKSRSLYEKKKSLFTGLDLTVVTPSDWLRRQTKQSFFKEYPVCTIHNGIDLSVFHPTQSNFRLKHHLENSKIVLGVSYVWNERKGLDVFLRLARDLPESHRLVLVGTNDKTDAVLPDNVISIHRTEDAASLAEIYTAADVFVNPTREENYPTVNMEAIACCTPVVTFDTGGSGEMLTPESGIIVKKNDYDALLSAILQATDGSRYKNGCIGRGQEFDEGAAYAAYAALINRLFR